eukprot:gene22105-28204_t
MAIQPGLTQIVPEEPALSLRLGLEPSKMPTMPTLLWSAPIKELVIENLANASVSQITMELPKQLAVEANRVYSTPWDAEKQVGCVCDLGRRADVLKGYGNEAGRDCSGRGLCDYSSGICGCFHGYYGTKCEYQTVLG